MVLMNGNGDDFGCTIRQVAYCKEVRPGKHLHYVSKVSGHFYAIEEFNFFNIRKLVILEIV